MYLKLSIALAFLSCPLNFAMDGHDYEQVMSGDRNSANHQACADLAKKVDNLIKQKGAERDKELMSAFFTSINLTCYNVTDKTLAYIDKNRALIQALVTTNITAIIILANEMDPLIINQLRLIFAENNKENSLKKAMSILFDEKTDLNKLDIKHMSNDHHANSSWSKSIALTLEQVLLNNLSYSIAAEF